MQTIRTAVDMFMHELTDIYDAEHRFLEGNRKLFERSEDERLRDAIERHIVESEGQIRNLEAVFADLGARPERQPCLGAQGLVEEGSKLLEESEGAIRDTLITGAASKVEHYEIVSYTDLVEGARAMGKEKVVTLLEKNLKQEERAAQKLQREGERLLKAVVKSSS